MWTSPSRCPRSPRRSRRTWKTWSECWGIKGAQGGRKLLYEVCHVDGRWNGGSSGGGAERSNTIASREDAQSGLSDAERRTGAGENYPGRVLSGQRRDATGASGIRSQEVLHGTRSL